MTRDGIVASAIPCPACEAWPDTVQDFASHLETEHPGNARRTREAIAASRTKKEKGSGQNEDGQVPSPRRGPSPSHPTGRSYQDLADVIGASPQSAQRWLMDGFRPAASHHRARVAIVRGEVEGGVEEWLDMAITAEERGNKGAAEWALGRAVESEGSA